MKSVAFVAVLVLFAMATSPAFAGTPCGHRDRVDDCSDVANPRTITILAALNVPEPGTIALLSLGLGGLALAGGSRRP